MITAGYPPEFIRDGMTLRDFKAATLSSMKDKIEEQRGISLAVGLAIASAFDSKATSQAVQSIENTIKDIESEQHGLFVLGGEFAPTVNRAQVRQEAVRRGDEKDSSGLSRKQVKTWQTLTKIDAAFSKLTGQMTGAPWSKVNMGNLSNEMGHFEQEASRVSGERIVSEITRGMQAERAGRMKPGRRK